MSPLPGVEELLLRQRSYYEVLSTWERRPWGVIGFNPANLFSHDSNHAYLEAALPPRELPAVLDEVAQWFRARGAEPRLRFHVPPHAPDLLPPAMAAGWDGCWERETWRAWPVDRACEQPPQVPGMTLSLVNAQALEDLLAVYTEGAGEAASLRQRGVWSALSGHADAECLLARVGGEPAAALACVWRDARGSIENVQTRERFRRRGIATAMIRFMQRHAVERGARGLYLYDTEAGPDRIYARAGLQLVARVRQAHLWLPAEPPESADA